MRRSRIARHIALGLSRTASVLPLAPGRDQISRMSDNVFLFGAGASFDAGIPLLGSFMEKMFEMALTKRSPQGALSEADLKVFSEAIEIRNRMDTYHARVSIDQFNLEEILSILYFEAQAGSKNGKKDLDTFENAVARTIELTCNVKHNGKLNEIQSVGASVYRAFWRILFALYGQRMISMPDILTFNYDLVFERALFQSSIGHGGSMIWRNSKTSGFVVDYMGGNLKKFGYKFKYARWGDYSTEKHDGNCLEEFDIDQENIPENFTYIKYLKLHGSLNFPSKKSTEEASLVQSLENPKIIPPVFNKADSTFASTIWKEALNSLKNCKNLIICGYSLPTTDTYMQYFLKAGLGANKDLTRIFVFDPLLSEEGQAGEDLKNRYAKCFSEKWQKRIIYTPHHSEKMGKAGTFSHFISLLKASPDSLLFGLDPAKEKPTSGIVF